MTFKWGQGHLIILKYLHHVTYVSYCKISINIEIILTLLGVKTIATNANSNVDVIACLYPPQNRVLVGYTVFIMSEIP